MTGEYTRPESWTALVNAQAITDTGSNTSGAVSNDATLGTEVSVQIAYGGTATEGVKVYVAAETEPHVGDFKIILTNDSGASVTADVDYRQPTVNP